MFPDNAIGNGQAQASALASLLGGEKGVKDLFPGLVWPGRLIGAARRPGVIRNLIGSGVAGQPIRPRCFPQLEPLGWPAG